MKHFAVFTHMLVVGFYFLGLVLGIPHPTSDSEGINLFKRQFEPDPNLIGPFSLVTTSRNPEYNNLTIFGRHIGAGINLAIVGSSSPPVPLPDSRYYTYYLNTTYGSPEDPNDPGSTRSGTLVYPIYEQYPLAVTGSLNFNTSSNIAQLWLAVVTPSYAFSFNSKGMLGLSNVYDRWHVCPNLYTSYGPMTGIAWRMGTGRIDDKDCVPVGIRRYEFPKEE